MKLAKLPAELRVKLDEDKGRDDAPVFVYAPLTLNQVAEVYGPDFVTTVRHCADAFRIGIRRIEVDGKAIEVDNEPFDPKKNEHIEALDSSWCLSIGLKILNRAKLSETEAGK